MFRREDLKEGMIVKFNGEDTYRVFFQGRFLGDINYIDFTDITEDLACYWDRNFYITGVYRLKSIYSLKAFNLNPSSLELISEIQKRFKKQDLKNGMIVEFKDGTRGMVIKDVALYGDRREDIVKYNDGYDAIKDIFDNNLNNISEFTDKTVVKIYETTTWGRKNDNLLYNYGTEKDELEKSCIWIREEL